LLLTPEPTSTDNLLVSADVAAGISVAAGVAASNNADEATEEAVSLLSASGQSFKDTAVIPQQLKIGTVKRKKLENYYLTSSDQIINVTEAKEKKTAVGRRLGNSGKDKTKPKDMKGKGKDVTSKRKRGSRKQKAGFVDERKTAASEAEQDNTPCIIRSRRYNEPPSDSWTQCKDCNGWYHDSCGPGDVDLCYNCCYLTVDIE